MDFVVDLFSFLTFIISFILLIYVLKFSKTNKVLKFLVVLLFIAIIGENLLHFVDFFNGFIDGFNKQM